MSVLRIEVVDACSLCIGRIEVERLVNLFIGIHFAQCVEIAEAAVTLGRHDVRTFAVLVPGGDHGELFLPCTLGSIGREVFVTDPGVCGLEIFNRHHRVADTVPRNAVEADRDGRNGIHLGGSLLAFEDRGLVYVELVALAAPVIGICTVKAHACKRIGGGAAGQVDHTVIAELLDFFFEVIEAFLDLGSAAELFGELTGTEDAQHELIVDRHITAVLEVVFHEVRHIVVLPCVEILRSCRIGAFPNEAVLHSVAVIGVQIAVVEMHTVV